MSDYERYGDYNEIEEDGGKSKNPVIIIIKALIALVCITVVGVLAFRMVIFNTYPEGARTLYYNDTLTDYYRSTDGNLGAVTQDLRFPYDDEDLGNFFCDYLVVIKGADQLQITARYNTASLPRLAQENGLEAIDGEDKNAFTYRLRDNLGRVYDEVTVGRFESQVMYRYARLVFDGVDLEPDSEGKYPEWIRLEITVTGGDATKVYMVPIYENNEDYKLFSDYVPKKSEVPNGK